MGILPSHVYWQVLTFLLVMQTTVWSQSQSAGSPPEGTSQPSVVTLVESVTPSYNIEPVVQRFQGRRGEVIPFRFVITSTGKSMNVAVKLVGLRQELSGIILPATEAIVPVDVELTTPATFSLSPGESREITGTLRVPLAKTNFLSYGLLVRDAGAVSEPGELATGEAANTTASIRFVTQYVLRLDIQTGMITSEGLDALNLHDGTIRSVAGMPVVEAILDNPTDLALECQVSAELVSPLNDRPQPFLLSLPSRAKLTGGEQYLVRVMPRSRVRVAAAVDEMLFPGPQTLRIKIKYGRRDLVVENFPIEIQEGEFPAVEAQIAHLPNRMAVEPAQITVGQLAGMRRTAVLRFFNNSAEEQSIDLQAVDLRGQALDCLRLSHESFSIRSGKAKNVRVALFGSSSEAGPVAAGRIRVAVSSDGSNQQSSHLPIAILTRQLPPTQLEVAPLQFLRMDDQSAFRVSVTNPGDRYQPVHIELNVAQQNSATMRLTEGFGKWLAPAETREFDLIAEHSLPQGTYQLGLTVHSSEQLPAITETLQVELPPQLDAEEIVAAAE